MQHQVEGADGAGLHAGEAAIEFEALVGQQASGAAGLGDALLAKVDVPPAGESILEVPLRLAVAQQDERRHQASTFSATFAFSAFAFFRSGRIACRASR